MIFDRTIVREDRDYDYWFGYSNDSLTKLCVAFNLPKTGSKKEKAARLCFAWELGYEPKGSDDEAKVIEEEWGLKLKLPEFTLPDPRKIDSNLWTAGPPADLVPVFDRRNILDYYSKNPFIAPTGVNDLNRYTSTVAYTLWQNGRVHGMKCHAAANCVIVSAKCRSTMMNNEYETWFAMHPTTAEIFTGYCSCIAGLPGYCKHLFATLFSVEFYSDTDETNPSCTSMSQQWGQPSSSSSVPPTPAVNLTLRKSVLDHEPRTSLITVQKARFAETVSIMSKESQTELIAKMEAKFARCALVKVESVIESKSIVRTLRSFVFEWKGKVDISVDEKVSGCYNEMRSYFNAIKTNEIEQETRQQSSNPLWLEHRIYRVTASVAGDVLAAVRRFEDTYDKLPADEKVLHGDFYRYFDSLAADAKETAVTKLLPPTRLARLQGAQFDGPATIYGRRSEEIALKEYLQQHRKAGCVDATMETSRGLFVNPEWPYLGASLDGVMNCSRHGRRVIEVKCPYRCDSSRPDSERKGLLDILDISEETGGLAYNPHYWQQVVQMAVTGIHKSDLYFWSTSESFSESVQFDQNQWEDVITRLEWYFHRILLPTVLRA